MLRSNPCKGKLIVVEGIDGSGKSTQIDLLYKWLQSLKKSVYFSEWNSSPLVKSTTRLGKNQRMFTPTTFSLIQATDFADRWENHFLPLLKAGVIILADRYAFTGFARDVARGVDPNWVRNLYAFAFQPDMTLYFHIPLEIAIERIVTSRTKIKFYEAGMDMGLAENKLQSFRIFQQRILDEYEKMIGEYHFQVIDATQSVHRQQKQIREMVQNTIQDWDGLLNPTTVQQNNSKGKITGQ